MSEATIGVPDETWGETVKALVVLAQGASATERELVDHCRARIAHYECPTSVELRAELARTAIGKLQKFKLREPYWEGLARKDWQKAEPGPVAIFRQQLDDALLCPCAPHPLVRSRAMVTTTGHGATGFHDEFDKLAPLIREEWPDVDADALTATRGDYERVVTLIAAKTEHTKALVKRQLDELRAIATDGNGKGGSLGIDQGVQQMLNKLHDKSNEIAGYVKKQMVTDAKVKVSENPLVSLLMAIGLGFVLGFILRGMGRRDRQR